MLEQLIKALEEWATSSRYIESVIIVGSYARGTNKVTSDVDLCIITPIKQKWSKNKILLNALEQLRKSKRNTMERVRQFVYGMKMGKKLNLALLSRHG